MTNKIILTLLAFTAATVMSISSSCQIQVANENDRTFTIPVDISSQRPVLELMINGEGPYLFIFDTGSSGSVIDEKLARELELEIIGVDSMGTPGSETVLMSKRVKVPRVTFKGIDQSQDAVMNMIDIREMLPVDGILSPKFFSDYLITIDYQNSVLHLSSGKLSKGDKDVYAFTQNNRVINFDVTIDGHPHEAHLDSGNPGGIDIPFSLKDKLRFKREPSENGVIQTPAGRFKKWEAVLLGDINIGSVVYRDPAVQMVEGFPFVNLGFQVFKELKITIDKKNQLIKFEKNTPTATKEMSEAHQGKKNDYTGWYGGHKRNIFLENGEMYLQRGSAPKLMLVKVMDNEYKMVFSLPVRNELPLIRFERDENNTVTGLTFVYKDGMEEFVKKD